MYFEYASFKYHKPNIRWKIYFDFTPYTDFFQRNCGGSKRTQNLKKNIFPA